MNLNTSILLYILFTGIDSYLEIGLIVYIISEDIIFSLQIMSVAILLGYKNYVIYGIILLIFSGVINYIYYLVQDFDKDNRISSATKKNLTITSYSFQIFIVIIGIVQNVMLPILIVCILIFLQIPGIVNADFDGDIKLEFLKILVFFGVLLFFAWFLIQMPPTNLGQKQFKIIISIPFAIGGGILTFLGICSLSSIDDPNKKKKDAVADTFFISGYLSLITFTIYRRLLKGTPNPLYIGLIITIGIFFIITFSFLCNELFKTKKSNLRKLIGHCMYSGGSLILIFIAEFTYSAEVDVSFLLYPIFNSNPIIIPKISILFIIPTFLLIGFSFFILFTLYYPNTLQFLSEIKSKRKIINKFKEPRDSSYSRRSLNLPRSGKKTHKIDSQHPPHYSSLGSDLKRYSLYKEPIPFENLGKKPIPFKKLEKKSNSDNLSKLYIKKKRDTSKIIKNKSKYCDQCGLNIKKYIRDSFCPYCGNLISLKKKVKVKKDNGSNIISLINNGKYDDALNLLESQDIQVDKFLIHFKSLTLDFKKEPSIDLLISMLKLFSLTNVQDYGKLIIKKWKNVMLPHIYEFFISNLDLIIQKMDFKPILDLILSNFHQFPNFVVDISEKIIKYPNDKKIMAFLLSISGELQDRELKRETEIIHVWIDIILKLKEAQINNSAKFLEFILNYLNQTEEFIVIRYLIKYYYESFYISFKLKDVNNFNNFSEFLDKLKHVIYKHPNEDNRDLIIQEIEGYTDILAESYRKLILSRMRAQDLDNILALGRNSLVMMMGELMRNISTVNPSPFSRCLKKLIDGWPDFPKLRKYISFESHRYRYQYRMPSQIISLKPVFWFMILEIILFQHFDRYYRRLPEDETIHHENILEILATIINLSYERFNIPSIPFSYSQNRELFIKFLKNINQKTRCSNEELRELILGSKWKSDSNIILEKVLEHKNYCVYCSYNMPPEVKKCPNCGREVKEISFDKPTIDFEKMENFFGPSD